MQNIDTTIAGNQQNVIHSSLDSDISTKQDKQKQQTRQQESIFSTCNTTSDPSRSFMHVDALSGIRRASAVAAAPNPERIYEGLSSALAAHPPSTMDQSSRLKFSAARNINDFISIRRPSSSSKQDKGLFVNMDCMLVFTFIRAGATKDNKHSTSSLDFRQM